MEIKAQLQALRCDGVDVTPKNWVIFGLFMFTLKRQEPQRLQYSKSEERRSEEWHIISHVAIWQCFNNLPSNAAPKLAKWLPIMIIYQCYCVGSRYTYTAVYSVHCSLTILLQFKILFYIHTAV